MTGWTLWLALAAVLVGSVFQRAAGTGFALIAAPLLVVVLGPHDGVLIGNMCGALTAWVNAIALRRNLDLSRIRWLVPGALIGCLLGYPLVRFLPSAWLGLLVSCIVLTGLLVTMVAPGTRAPDRGPVRLLTGVMTGFGSVTSSIGGPPMAVYARAVRMDHRVYAPTALMTFASTGTLATILKWPPPALPTSQWVMIGAALVVGTLAGRALSRRLQGATAMRIVLVLAFVGTVAALVKSLIALLG